jgi:hypothetical protein
MSDALEELPHEEGDAAAGFGGGEIGAEHDGDTDCREEAGDTKSKTPASAVLEPAAE